MGAAARSWWERELAGCAFADARLGRRLRKLIERMDGAIGASLPLACQDWANTKAAYRFFSNDRVSEAQILAGHFQATRDRFAATAGPILVLQDTTEFTYPAGARRGDRRHATSVNSGKDKYGGRRLHTVCGLLMHSSLAVTLEGLPLGLVGGQVLDAPEVQGHRRPQDGRSTRRACRSSRRRASAGWRTCASPPRCSAIRPAASISATARATSTSCSARPRSSAPTSWSAPASTGWPVTATTRSPTRWRGARSAGLHRVEVRDGKGDLGSACRRDQIPPHPRPAADRQAEALSRAHADGDPRPGARRARRSAERSTGS